MSELRMEARHRRQLELPFVIWQHRNPVFEPMIVIRCAHAVASHMHTCLLTTNREPRTLCQFCFCISANAFEVNVLRTWQLNRSSMLKWLCYQRTNTTKAPNEWAYAVCARDWDQQQRVIVRNGTSTIPSESTFQWKQLEMVRGGNCQRVSRNIEWTGETRRKSIDDNICHPASSRSFILIYLHVAVFVCDLSPFLTSIFLRSESFFCRKFLSISIKTHITVCIRIAKFISTETQTLSADSLAAFNFRTKSPCSWISFNSFSRFSLILGAFGAILIFDSEKYQFYSFHWHFQLGATHKKLD